MTTVISKQEETIMILVSGATGRPPSQGAHGE